MTFRILFVAAGRNVAFVFRFKVSLFFTINQVVLGGNYKMNNSATLSVPFKDTTR